MAIDHKLMTLNSGTSLHVQGKLARGDTGEAELKRWS
jgi:hypothetical protein